MIRKLRFAALLVCFGMICLAVSPNARADMWNKKTILTFSAPVRVANTTLPAGTYVFKLADTTDRHVVQIFNKDENHLYATVLANAAFRMEPADKTVVKFAETASSGATSSGTLPESGVPIRQWFYPGDTYGISFPIHPAAMTETAAALPAPAPPEDAPAAAAEPAPAPEPQPAETAEAQPAPTPAPQPQPQAEAPSTEPAPSPAPAASSLPKTASAMPLIGLIGLLSLGSAAGLGLARRRTDR